MNEWRRSSFCPQGGCIEVKEFPDRVILRDSRNPTYPIVQTHKEWEAFLKGIKAGEFDPK